MKMCSFSLTSDNRFADTNPGCHHLLLRRNDRTGEPVTCAATAHAPSRCTPRSARPDSAWRIEESVQAAKHVTGLDQHQVRRWTSWQRWTTLAMLAHAFLAVATADERDRIPLRD
jgi:SRSO17 transposase